MKGRIYQQPEKIICALYTESNLEIYIDSKDGNIERKKKRCWNTHENQMLETLSSNFLNLYFYKRVVKICSENKLNFSPLYINRTSKYKETLNVSPKITR
jgi:hypothetical protein